ncbi:MAG: hypothetical protein JJE18_06460, partial [Eubacteriaceae bacterium]|nr:hypothetical protein [Eubacteriaceae bacterium]
MKRPVKSNELHDTHSQSQDNEMLGVLQRRTFTYFLKEMNGQTGLIADKTQPGS